VEILQPATLEDALALRAAHPDAKALAGGTDLMVELNFDRARPPAILDLTKVPELTEWAPDDGRVRVGAGVTYTRIVDELGDRLPGLAIASRTVGSLQIRNRGTVGGNLATASPAGDGLPPLYTADAVVEVASVRGTRRVPVAELITGPKRTGLAPDELITAYELPAATGPQQFAKVGTRNAMVIAVCSFALSLRQGEVGAAIGSAAPTPRRAREAEEFLAAELPWGSSEALPDSLKRRFGELVAEATSPIDDVRGSAAYRKHALGVLARRTLTWAWDEHRTGERACA
jgi:CO/xanthine dehydrogenase FAD-binding subunit